MPQFRVDVASEGADVVARVFGEVDLATAPVLLTATQEASGAGLLVVDLTETEFLDSSGCRALATAGRSARAGGGRLAVVCPKENVAVYRVVELVGLAAVVDLHSTVSSARATG